MHPADFASHSAARQRRDRRRLAEAVRQVALHANAEQHVELERLVTLFDAEQLGIDAALGLVATLRRQLQAAA